MKKTYIFIILIAMVILVLAIYIGSGSIPLFLSAPSIMLTLILSLLLTLSTFSPSEIVDFFMIAFRKNTTNIPKIRNGIHFFKTFQSYLILSALFSFIMGIILILANLDDPEKIGPGIAVALLTIFYSLVLMLLITTPFKAGLRRMLNEISE